MDTNDQIFELMTKMYAEMQEGFKKNDTEMQGIKQLLGNVEYRMVKMENDNQKNFTALFDGYKQNSDKLDRIENEVSRQQEVIIRKIK